MVISNNWGFGLWLWSSINVLRLPLKNDRFVMSTTVSSPDNFNPIWIKRGHLSPNVLFAEHRFLSSNAAASSFPPLPDQTAICGFLIVVQEGQWSNRNETFKFLFVSFYKTPQCSIRWVVCSESCGPRAKCRNSQPEFEQLPQTQWEILVRWQFPSKKIFTLHTARSCISRVSVNTHPRFNRCPRRWLQTIKWLLSPEELIEMTVKPEKNPTEYVLISTNLLNYIQKTLNKAVTWTNLRMLRDSRKYSPTSLYSQTSSLPWRLQAEWVLFCVVMEVFYVLV